MGVWESGGVKRDVESEGMESERVESEGGIERWRVRHVTHCTVCVLSEA